MSEPKHRHRLTLTLDADTTDQLSDVLEDVLLAIARGVIGPVKEQAAEHDLLWNIEDTQPDTVPS